MGTCECARFWSWHPHRTKEALFDGTYICTDNRSDAKRGMGIGLSLCKTIIEAHGGKIGEKNHTKGAEIYFLLPMEDEEDESENTDTDY